MDNIIYSKEVLEFTTVAKEYCNLVENQVDMDGVKLLMLMQRLLPLLYIKTVMIPKTSSLLEDDLEHFVSQEDWDRVRNGLLTRIGAADDYRDIFPETPGESEEKFIGSISENLADIYQDLKDFVLRYRISTEDIMNDAIWDLQESFKLYWGQKLVNTLRAIHYSLSNPESIGGDRGDIQSGNENFDTSDWIITKRQQNLENDSDEFQG